MILHSRTSPFKESDSLCWSSIIKGDINHQGISLIASYHLSHFLGWLDGILEFFSDFKLLNEISEWSPSGQRDFISILLHLQQNFLREGIRGLLSHKANT